ncbi:GNAT family N-acetyltransferase [Pseudomonas sp. RAC1]|uniref:GNAT family N-acetyltransferase n=1 Tax=Pseudomonas sp. RAC1 TaxID=3064900 RepID=UPI00271A9DB7|nr:GNAT family N-acetyltransferase [Pseudomonas sp. RAC1]MDV9033028.1 GNAT family N-acetyltransferase [Pseudomonas sp. RAC1]
MSCITFRNAVPADADRCYEIEISAYEGDEAATQAKIAIRIAQYPEGFLILEIDGVTAGFINCGCAHEVRMSDEEFKELDGHDPEAPNVVIMSVVVAPEHQGNGYATRMMEVFVGNMQHLGKESIHLMCKQQHVELYTRLGYKYCQTSASDHGGMAWHEMMMAL